VAVTAAFALVNILAHVCLLEVSPVHLERV
jgi:hypothetical protein